MGKTVTPETHPNMDRSPFPCLVCGREFCNVVSVEQCQNQPYDACTFTSRGHYGSTIFDEIDGAKIEINICDDCITAAVEKKHVGYWPGNPNRKLTVWNGID